MDQALRREIEDLRKLKLKQLKLRYRELFGESPSETLRRPGEPWESHRHRPASLLSDAVAELPH